ncbi:hypothetical protein C8R43DRAFT_491093 [Mycena crocata]|nr:hypothetical protein C8R43DRAFT_491093 [Mycena crocata]
MLVDSQMSQPLYAPPYTDYSQDLSDIFHTELFSLPSSAASSSSQSSGSRESTPHVLTPPQAPPQASFPDINDGSPTPSFFNFLDEDVKTHDPLSMLSGIPYDFFGVGAFPGTLESGGGGGGGPTMADTDMLLSGASEMLGIDPQLVGSPAQASYADFESDSQTSPGSSSGSGSGSGSQAQASSPEESTTIAPVKVGGHGKARKGTVASGGISKKAASSSAASTQSNSTSYSSGASLNKENSSFMPSTTFKPRGKGASNADDDEDDDDLPADWRPPPEVFQKMSSKEKRQLRNKISARNFRVRRKEYISTLEDNIAERDRLLSAIRSELGSSQSENLALRQEIAALKRTLIEGRGGLQMPVLPPPAPLSPSLSALTAFSPSASGSAPGSPALSAVGSPSANANKEKEREALPRANTHKDLSATSQRFWGGSVSPAMLGGGYTSVHTARIPDLLGAHPFAQSPFAVETPSPPAQQENLNPALNGGKVAEVLRSGLGLGAGTGTPGENAFGDANPFTVRSLDAYRMHLWGRMAAQYRHNKEHGGNNNAANNNAANNNNNALFNASPFASGNANSGFTGANGSAFVNNSGFTSSNNSSGFANASPFTSAKTHSPPHSPPFPLSGLAGGLRPKYFASPTMGAFAGAGTFSGKDHASTSGSRDSKDAASNLAASLSGLSLSGKGNALQKERERTREKERERAAESARERETAMYAALASQTLLKRLGGAFWDAFSGSERGPGSPSNSSAGGARQNWDTEKVRKVLEGRAVVRVVDVEPVPTSPRVAAAATPKVLASPKIAPAVPSKREQASHCHQALSDCLEESMRSLSIKK